MSSQETGEAPRGLVLIFTGNGKGKTSAALGTLLRAAGYGYRCLLVQFIKEAGRSGEHISLKRLAPEVEVAVMGRGFVGMLGDELPIEEHRKAAREALDFAQKRMRTGDYHLVVLDEILVALKLELISVQDVLNLLDARPPHMTLILTGRGAPAELMERADTVTDMTEIKHAFQRGVPGVKGVDF
ncbi:MAG: cob(I)yrinic acid a,c-diamide adenosyltransferase [Calditrichaeota bacterium]|nr:cob(I)yrinic acid a,c-diamide adenosyltransferase [Calditrichota bacterium]